MGSENPYAPPDIPSDGPPRPADDSARVMFLAWERLRLIYNAILLVLVGTGMILGDSSLSLYQLTEYAIGANICFCLGPVVEGYASLVGFQRKRTRIVLFFLGTALAIAITWLTLSPNGLGFVHHSYIRIGP